MIMECQKHTCCALLNLWTSSINRTVRFFLSCRAPCASRTTFFTSCTPDVQADRETYFHFCDPRQRSRIMFANEVCANTHMNIKSELVKYQKIIQYDTNSYCVQIKWNSTRDTIYAYIMWNHGQCMTYYKRLTEYLSSSLFYGSMHACVSRFLGWLFSKLHNP